MKNSGVAGAAPTAGSGSRSRAKHPTTSCETFLEVSVIKKSPLNFQADVGSFPQHTHTHLSLPPSLRSPVPALWTRAASRHRRSGFQSSWRGRYPARARARPQSARHFYRPGFTVVSNRCLTNKAMLRPVRTCRLVAGSRRRNHHRDPIMLYSE